MTSVQQLQPRARGVDVSAYQVMSDPRAWFAAAQRAGISFCYLKSSEGNGTRSRVYAARAAACRELGLHVGPYHFAHPEALVGDPLREAALCHEVAGPWQPGDLPPALDLEEAPEGMTSSTLIDWARAWLRETERLSGRRPILYTGPYFWRQRLAYTGALAPWDLWVAQYPGAQVEPGPTVEPVRLAPWGTSWRLWQWTGSGRLPHHDGPLDLDLYHGTEAELELWCEGV